MSNTIRKVVPIERITFETKPTRYDGMSITRRYDIHHDWSHRWFLLGTFAPT